MSSQTVWNFWAACYNRLLAQAVSLQPTRRRIIDELLPSCQGGERILDVGCGTGQLLSELNRVLPEPELWGVDYSPAMIGQARLAVPAARLFCLDAARLPQLPQLPREPYFDVIVCTHSLPYYQDPALCLNNMLRLLAPGGRLLIVHASANNWYDRFFLGIVKLTTGSAVYYSQPQLTAMLQRHDVTLKTALFKTRLWLPNFAFAEARLRPAES